MRRVFATRRADGYSFVELLIVTAILFILASAVMPLATVTSQRQRESELRTALRQMRTAIDKFKDAADAGRIPSTEVSAGSEGYPPDLQTLVDGVSLLNDQSGTKLKKRCCTESAAPTMAITAQRFMPPARNRGAT